MHQYQERDGEKDRKPGGKTLVKDIWEVGGEERGRTYWTGQSGRMIFNTIPATPDDGKTQGEEEEACCEQY